MDNPNIRIINRPRVNIPSLNREEDEDEGTDLGTVEIKEIENYDENNIFDNPNIKIIP